MPSKPIAKRGRDTSSGFSETNASHPKTCKQYSDMSDLVSL